MPRVKKPIERMFRRREFMQFSACGALAHLLAAGLESGEKPAGVGPHIESCILLMYYGGPSHLDTWDMKPDASPEVRGEFAPISTQVPGLFVCEHLPRTAKLVDKLAVIRSMHHPMTNHNAAMYEALIGRLPGGGDAELLGIDRTNDFPNHGAVLSYLVEQGKLPKPRIPLTNVALPHVMYNVVKLAGQNAGFLNARFDPFQIDRDPNDPQFRVDELKLLQDVSPDRLSARRSLLEELDQTTMSSAAVKTLHENQQRAYELIGSQEAQLAFEIEQEPDRIRDRYGRHRLGQSMLLARRLVEAGVRFINVNDKIHNGQEANWDSHQQVFPRHKDDLLPPADQAYSALIEDLDQRGLLDTTLVIAMGEFGRTPKINGNAGRDHWPNCYSVVLGGGGVTGGATYGTSDNIGAFPASDPVTPGDLAATIFSRFGLDSNLEIHDSLGRPYRLAEGNPIQHLFD